MAVHWLLLWNSSIKEFLKIEIQASTSPRFIFNGRFLQGLELDNDKISLPVAVSRAKELALKFFIICFFIQSMSFSEFIEPIDICVDSHGRLFIADTSCGKVFFLFYIFEFCTQTNDTSFSYMLAKVIFFKIIPISIS